MTENTEPESDGGYPHDMRPRGGFIKIAQSLIEVGYFQVSEGI